MAISSTQEAWSVTLKSPLEFGNMLFPKTSSRVDGRQCAARHRLRSRKGSPGQHAGKNSTCRSPESIWGTREWSFRHGSARLLEGLSQAVACLLSGPAIPCDLGAGKDQISPNQQKDREPDQILQARCRDRQADQRRAATHHQRTSANRSNARASKAS
jgi:hypothetical protein